MGESGSEQATVRRRGESERTTTLGADELPLERARPLPPRTTLNRYVILGVLGEGGMGVVYSAYDPRLDRRIAVKLLARETSDRGNARMLAEARAMARLNHPNVVKVHDVGMHDESVFIAMESVEGETLEGLRVSERSSVREVVGAYLDAGEGLAAAHAVGLIHRDFKPANVMRTPDGRVVVLDFGLARASAFDSAPVDESAPASSLTATGTVMGTPAYMSPEQYAGDRIEATSDQFSFCIALYEALYDKRPFDDLARLTRRPRPEGRDIPRPIAHAIDVGLALDPKQRHPSMRALVDELRSHVTERRRFVLPTVAVVALGIVGGVGLLLPSHQQDHCRGPFTRLEEAYDESRRAAIIEAFAVLSTPGADQTGRRVVGRLDHYASEWAEARTTACRAEQSAEGSSKLQTQRLMCLDERLFALESLASAATEVSESSLHKAVLRTAELPTIARCNDRGFLLAEVRPPEQPALIVEVRDIGRTLAKLQYRLDTFDDVKDADRLIERARAAGYDPILAEVLSVVAQVVSHHDTRRARTLAFEALLVAERSGHDRGIVVSRIELAQLDGEAGLRELAVEHLQFAEATLARIESPGLLEIGLLEARARFEMLDQRPADARATLERVAELRRKNDTLDTLAFQASAAFLSEACLRLHDYKCAREYLQLVLRVTERDLGPLHPYRGQLLALAADLNLAEGHADEALVLFEQAAQLFGASDETGFNRSVLANNRGSAYILKGDFAAAQAAFEDAIAIILDAYGPSHPNVVVYRSNLAELLVRDGRFEQACRHIDGLRQRGLDGFEGGRNFVRRVQAQHGDCLRRAGDSDAARKIYENALELEEGEDPSGTGYAMVLRGLAELELEQGNLRRAEELARRVAPLRPSKDVEGFAALARFTLARVLARTDRAEEALELARAAERDLARFPSWPHERADVRRWLERHGSK